MVEITYSRGVKIILLSAQHKGGALTCRFTIPDLLDSHRFQDEPIDEYKTEWEAKTAAFESAKRALDRAQEHCGISIPGEPS